MSPRHLMTLAAAAALFVHCAPIALAQDAAGPKKVPAEAEQDPNAGPKADPDADPKQDPEGDPKADPNAGPNADPKTGKPKTPERPKDKVIKVFLKNGNLISGYALGGVIYERAVELASTAKTDKGATGAAAAMMKRQEAYEPVKDKKAAGAGVRIWYPNNVKGYQFIPYTQVLQVEMGRTLSAAEQKALFADIRTKEKKLTEARLKMIESNNAKTAAILAARAALAEEQIAKAKGVSVEDDRKRRTDMLQKFPPSAGWGAARRAEIDRKLAVLGQPPTAQEQEFLRIYADWKVAYDEAKKIGVIPEAATPGEKEDDPKPDDGSDAK